MRLSQWLSPTLEDHQSIPVGRTFAGTPAAVWTLAVLCIMRGVSTLMSYVSPIAGLSTTSDRLVIGVLAILLGALLFSPRLRIADWQLQAIVLLNTLVVGWLCATAPVDLRVAVNLFGLLGLAVYVGAWFTTRQALLHMLAVTIVSAAAIGTRDGAHLLTGVWVTAIATAVGVMLLLHIIMRHQARAATVDHLTGVLSRSGLSAIVDRPAVAAQLRQPLSLALIDLDGFKAVNDAQGHEAGDALLREVGDLLRRETRESDVTARLGGDEFVIILGGTTSPRAHEIVGRLVARLPIGASYGIAPWAAGVSFDEVLRAADAAMYAQKEQRRRA